MANTINDFWRMIAQERVALIVTTCNLKEGSRPKCEKFWSDPDDTSLFATVEN